ncbi:Protein FAR1-RELATED SEQUENCE 11 [Bienertia sinuspersici]
MRITLKKCFDIFPEEWHVTKFVKEHNHELLSSEEMRFLPANRTISQEDEKQILLYKEAGLSVRQIIQVMELEKKTFVTLMKKPPKTIITDQDPWMSEAIETELPTTKHSFCIWYITSKFSCWFAALFRTAYQDWCADFYGAYKTTIATEFEHKWNVMVHKYDLQENKHIQGLYDVKYFWAPAYLRDHFFGGMITTGRSESINAFIKKFVSSHVSLTDFVKQIDIAVQEIGQGRICNNMTAILRPIPVKSKSALEEQASSVVQEGDVHSTSNQGVLHTTYEVQGDNVELEEESNIVNNASTDEHVVYLPPKSKTKGRPKKRREKGGKELGKKTKCCSICKQPGHTKPTCPNKDNIFGIKETEEGATSTSHKRLKKAVDELGINPVFTLKF